MAYLEQREKKELDAIERQVSAALQQVEKAEVLLQREEAKAGKINGEIDYDNGSESLKAAVRAYNAAASKYTKSIDWKVAWLKARILAFPLFQWFCGKPSHADPAGSQDLKIC